MNDYVYVLDLAEAFCDRQTKVWEVVATAIAGDEDRSCHGATLSQSVCECSLT